MRPRPPKKLTLEGEPIAIEYSDKLGRIDGKYRTGGQAFKNKVKLTNGMTLGAEQATLIHELLHVCLAKSGMSLPTATEEQVFDAIDSWLAQLLRENPELATYLTADPFAVPA